MGALAKIAFPIARTHEKQCTTCAPITKFSFSQNPIPFSSLHKISATQDCVVNDPNLVFYGDSMLKKLEESCNENELFEINIVGFRSHKTLML